MKLPFMSPSRSRAQAAAALVDTLPRTQTQVRVVDARDNCLIDCDRTVIAAVGLASVNTALMAPGAVASRVEHYREFLKTLRYPIQFLIGTRPQDVGAYEQVLLAREQALAERCQQLTLCIALLPAYLALPSAQLSPAGFATHFGWTPNDLIGLPGGAREVAHALCDPDRARTLTYEAAAGRVVDTIAVIERWRALLLEQADLVSDTVQRAQAPVRTCFIVTSLNPRLSVRLAARPTGRSAVQRPLAGGALREDEFEAARERLDERCRQIYSGITAMGVRCWRATHDELLLELRHFFNPGLSLLARRGANDLDDLALPTEAASRAATRAATQAPTLGAARYREATR